MSQYTFKVTNPSYKSEYDKDVDQALLSEINALFEGEYVFEDDEDHNFMVFNKIGSYRFKTFKIHKTRFNKVGLTDYFRGTLKRMGNITLYRSYPTYQKIIEKISTVVPIYRKDRINDLMKYL